jgi:aerobic-type carbon monoxide dehydrogenase small subunit (CoxS/CutS family)
MDEPRRWVKPPPAEELTVHCTVDGDDVTIVTWTDMSALLALRLSGRRGKPRRGCEAGQCGACESTLNGEVVRLCQLRPAVLEGATIVTGNN